MALFILLSLIFVIKQAVKELNIVYNSKKQTCYLRRIYIGNPLIVRRRRNKRFMFLACSRSHFVSINTKSTNNNNTCHRKSYVTDFFFLIQFFLDSGGKRASANASQWCVRLAARICAWPYYINRLVKICQHFHYLI